MEIFIATYVVFFVLLNFINMFIKAINSKVGKFIEDEEKIIGKVIYENNVNEM
ncbi:hypothetical protein [Terrisporobacter sp.]|uniref:hypothetical protein n=1 Tax=Terrisporobacter sp. TaxID=1965305 RepID=UPI0028A1EA76|nr:hypothetical protein [Terrisporobacter sp.]